MVMAHTAAHQLSRGVTARRCFARRSRTSAPERYERLLTSARLRGVPRAVAPGGPCRATSPVHLPTSSPLHPYRGFALVDVITAAILLGVALAVAIGLISRAISSQQLGEDLQVAAMLADEQLNLVLARGPDDYGKQFPLAGSCDPPFERFRYALELSGGSESSPYGVAVTIAWGAGVGSGRAVTVHTLMASRLGDDPDPDRLPVEPIQRY